MKISVHGGLLVIVEFFVDAVGNVELIHVNCYLRHQLIGIGVAHGDFAQIELLVVLGKTGRLGGSLRWRRWSAAVVFENTLRLDGRASGSNLLLKAGDGVCD